MGNRETAADRRAEAEAWFRELVQFENGGRPRQAARTVREAAKAGIDVDALRAVTYRVKSRSNAMEFLAVGGSWRRRHYTVVSEPDGSG